MLKKHMLCNIICSRFFVALASENNSKIQLFFGTFSKTSILRKCSETLAVRTKIKVRSLQKRKKITKKSIPKRTRKKHRKKASQKSILASILTSEILQKPSKSLPKATQNEAGSATLCKSHGSRRKSTGLATLGLRKWLCI